MKNLVIALFLAISLLGQAQSNDPMAAVYHEYQNGPGVTAFTFNKKMLDAVDLDFDWEEKVKHLSGDIYQIKLINFSEESSPAQRIKSMSSQFLTSDLEKIDLPKKHQNEMEDMQLSLWAQPSGGHYNNVYLLMLKDDGSHGLYLAISGKLTVKKS